MASLLNYEGGSLSFTYPRVPIGANMKFSKSWNPIIERFNIRLNKWKAKNLSFGCQLTLTKSVLGSLPL